MRLLIENHFFVRIEKLRETLSSLKAQFWRLYVGKCIACLWLMCAVILDHPDHVLSI